jgi:hypothetical protein
LRNATQRTRGSKRRSPFFLIERRGFGRQGIAIKVGPPTNERQKFRETLPLREE